MSNLLTRSGILLIVKRKSSQRLIQRVQSALNLFNVSLIISRF